MLNFKLNLFTGLLMFGMTVAGAPACTVRPETTMQINNSTDNISPQNTSPQKSGSAEVIRQTEAGSNAGLKVLAEGSFGQISEPFIAVTREPEVYRVLRSMVRELPELSADFFKSNTITAVFVGQRNTGGYSIEITRNDRGQVLVSERVPPSDAITTQALTNPFKVVAVLTKEDEDVTLLLQGGLAASLLRPYRVTSGEFMTTGAAPARAEKFRLEGGFKVTRLGELATMFFDLKGIATKSPSMLQTTRTVIVEQSGRFSIESLDAGTLVGGRSGRLHVTGQFTGDGDKLQLAFKSSSTSVTEGLSMSGEITAAASGPAPPKRQPDSSMF